MTTIRTTLLTAVGLVLLAGCTPATTARVTPVGSTSAAVPWLDSPATPTAGSTPAPATARACAGADLPATANHTRAGGISQTNSDFIELSNVGATRCTLPDRPTLQYTDSH